MCAYPSVLVSHLQAHLKRKQQKELMKKESSRLQKTGHRVTYSPRKEKALKIYLDGAPNKDLTQD